MQGLSEQSLVPFFIEQVGIDVGRSFRASLTVS
jgi:hypothetical protein